MEPGVFCSSILATEAILLSLEKIDCRPCRVSRIQKDLGKKEGNLFVKGLTPDIDHVTLGDLFGNFGPILSVKVALNPKGESRGYGFVQFEDPADASRAREALDGKIVNQKEM